jgi:hypothetical protein
VAWSAVELRFDPPAKRKALMDPSDEKQPLFTTNGTDPTIEPHEPFKRLGCTFLTAVVVFLLVCSVIYFITGLSAILLRFWETMR